ncbi:MAG: pyruvyl transferase [Proteobacteria bacterium]|nr:pyruvyl transferase [Pseudomonadota bacterium]
MSMSDLSEKLNQCADLLKGEVVYLDYPVYGNIGDHLIWQGAKALLNKNDVKVIGQFGKRLGLRAHRCMAKGATICMQGGGNFGDLYAYHQTFRSEIIQRYPDKRIVILPVSIHYKDKENFKAFYALLSTHPDIHICTRDAESLSFLKEYGVTNSYLFPDTAHAMWPVQTTGPEKEGSVLYLLRDDIEAAYLPEELGQVKAVDWCDLNKGMTRLCFDIGSRIDQIGGRLLGNYLPGYTTWSFASQKLIRDAVDLFSPYETIVTNRLHAMILAALMQKKCIVYDNSYGKLSRYYNLWLKDVPRIEFREI